MVYTNTTPREHKNNAFARHAAPCRSSSGVNRSPRTSSISVAARTKHRLRSARYYLESTLGGNFALDIDYFTTTSSSADYRVRSTLIRPERRRKRLVVSSPLRNSSSSTFLKPCNRDITDRRALLFRTDLLL